MLKTKISKDDPLLPGDEVELHFRFKGPNWVYLHAAEMALLEWKLKQKNPYWEMTRWDSTSDPEKLILHYRVLGSLPEQIPQVAKASIVTGVVIAAAVIGGGVFMWLSFEAIYKITESPAGQIALAGTGSAGIAVLVIAVILALRYYRKE